MKIEFFKQLQLQKYYLEQEGFRVIHTKWASSPHLLIVPAAIQSEELI